MIRAKSADLFAGIAVTEYAVALPWFERLLRPPAFSPHDKEAVWEFAEHRHVYIVEQAENPATR